MSRYVTIASLRFDLEHLHGLPDASERVMTDTRERLYALAGHGIDLVVLSEATSAVGMSVATAEDPASPGPWLQMYADAARMIESHLAASIYLRQDGAVPNSIVFISPIGELIGSYDKTIPTISELEMGITPGLGATVVESAIGRLGGAICFDLNFNDLRTEYSESNLDILCFPSMFHGGFAQQSWAYHTGAFFVAALPFNGASIVDPLGTVLATTSEYAPVIESRVNLDRFVMHLDFHHAKLQKIRERFGDEIRIDTPPHVGSVILYSESPIRTAAAIAAEYELESTRDYLARSRARVLTESRL